MSTHRDSQDMCYSRVKPRRTTRAKDSEARWEVSDHERKGGEKQNQKAKRINLNRIGGPTLLGSRHRQFVSELRVLTLRHPRVLPHTHTNKSSYSVCEASAVCARKLHQEVFCVCGLSLVFKIPQNTRLTPNTAQLTSLRYYEQNLDRIRQKPKRTHSQGILSTRLGSLQPRDGPRLGCVLPSHLLLQRKHRDKESTVMCWVASQ